MPEGDTVWLTAHRLNQALAGHAVEQFDLRVPQLALVDLRGRTVIEVLARGKHILIRFDADNGADGRVDGRVDGPGLTLHSHLRMDGSWRVAAADGRFRPTFEVRAVIGTAHWIAAGHRIHDLELAPTAEEDRWVGHLGPDLLGPDWDPVGATERLARAGERPIVEALLDQRNLAGVGNMYAAELLFLTGVNPYTPTARVPDLSALPPLAFRLLRANRDHPEQSTTGSTRRGEQHYVYLRTGQPCRRCGAAIEAGEFGVAPRQRRTFWCPRCQPQR